MKLCSGVRGECAENLKMRSGFEWVQSLSGRARIEGGVGKEECVEV